MTEPPSTVGSAKVICYTFVDGRHTPTGNCEQIVAGVLQGPAQGLAICQYKGEDAFYLFGCDAEWNTVTDTWHETLDDAMDQAEFEYSGVSKTWWFETSGKERDL